MRSPAFRFYVDNFIEGTMDMTDQECGLYMRLLCAQWNRGGLPDDDDELLRFSRGSTTLHLQRVKKKFEKCADGLLRNARLEHERAKQQEWSEKSAFGGRKSGISRKKSKGGSTTVGSKPPTKHEPTPQPNTNLPYPLPYPLPSPSPSSISNPNSIPPAAPVFSGEHKAFIQGWCENFKTENGFDYHMDGGRDGKAVKQLLKKGILRIDLLEMAKKAWKRSKQSPRAFNCEQAVTISGFESRFNNINAELNNANHQGNGFQNSRPLTGAEQRQVGIPNIETVAAARARRAAEAAKNGMAATAPAA